jgi:hypothetical protein
VKLTDEEADRTSDQGRQLSRRRRFRAGDASPRHGRRANRAQIPKPIQLRKRLPLNDLAQADLCQPAQCSQKHRSDYSARQTALLLQSVRHGLTAETVIGALEDAEDYQAFEAAIIVDYDAQSAVERELVLRLASLPWRLRRATIMETGLFEIQAEHLRGYRQVRQLLPHSRDVIHAVFGLAESESHDAREVSPNCKNDLETVAAVTSDGPAIEFARCFLRLANLPNFALDRLSRYEARFGAGPIRFYSRSIASIAVSRRRERAVSLLAIELPMR